MIPERSLKPLPKNAKHLNKHGKRPAAYVAFTREDKQTHEVQVLLGEVFSFDKNKAVASFGLPGGGSETGLRLRRARKDGTPTFFPRLQILEPPKLTAIRETHEETGIQLNPSQIDLALVIEQTNPLHRGKALVRLLQHLRRKTKPRQLSYVFVPTKNGLPERDCIDEYAIGGEMPRHRWLSVRQAKEEKEQGKIKVSKQVLEGMQVATEWHKIHVSDNPFLEEGFEYSIMITQQDAERIKSEMLAVAA